MEKKDAIRAYRLVVTGLATQQVYAQCHDEAVATGVFTQDLKNSSNNLVSKLEKKLKNLYQLLGEVNGGDEYVRAIATIDETMAELAGLPLEFWPTIILAIRNVKRAVLKAQLAGEQIQDGTEISITKEDAE